MSAVLFYVLLVIATLCIPVAYAMGQITGSEAMRREILSHPSTRIRNTRNQFEQSA
jgi:hypothetical protein